MRCLRSQEAVCFFEALPLAGLKANAVVSNALMSCQSWLQCLEHLEARPFRPFRRFLGL